MGVLMGVGETSWALRSSCLWSCSPLMDAVKELFSGPCHVPCTALDTSTLVMQPSPQPREGSCPPVSADWRLDGCPEVAQI